MTTPLHPKRKSQLGLFFAIYLLITLAVVSSIYFLRKEKDEELLIVASDRIISEVDLMAEGKGAAPEKVSEKKKLSHKPVLEAKVNVEPVSSKAEKAPSNGAADNHSEVKTEKKSKGPALSPEEESQITKLYPLPTFKPLMEIVSNWQLVPENAFPERVTIKRPVEFELSHGGVVAGRGTLPIGSSMIPVAQRGEMLTLSNGGSQPVIINIYVNETNFKEAIEDRYDRFVAKRNEHILAQRQAERERRIGLVKIEESLSDWNDGSAPRFDPAKLSLKNGEVGVYGLPDASKWRWGGSEMVDGVESDVAFVLIVAEAAFGITEKELKVIMRDGKVVKWIDLSSGEAF